ncbi:nucleotidyl transferase AbiEii/AbiGii toxin family protein [Embleya scabrispora]|uniref:nucleotidyl transferase AbiEii/AbiGii toxin family protein n=1 Tax=Embleya scabrispora TaxID=159449 RepID=UPI001FE1CD64|nr:nucleotidyl transferase AbiEii/AbiGii toxin family protein [Embleya scabrispora]
MRAGEPRFEDAAAEARWHRARRAVVDHVLEAVAGSRWVDDLVLRGSVLLKAWYGSVAREPGDLDFVVTPSGWDVGDGRTERMFVDIARRAEHSSAADGGPYDVRVVSTLALSDEIWTYDRVPGRRLVLPWRADGVPAGTVQLDFVFGEQLPSEPEPTEIPRSDGSGSHLLLGVTPGQSLAWKLLWLVDDIHPQGKDLYDAVLLAENTSLGVPLLRATFMASDPSHGSRPFTADSLAARVDLREFHKEYPELPGADLEARLLRALAPTFAAAAGVGANGYQRAVLRLAPWIARYGPFRDRPQVLLARLGADSWHLDAAVVVYREVVGRGTCDIAEAARIVAEYRDVSGAYDGYYARNPHLIGEAIERLR